MQQEEQHTEQQQRLHECMPLLLAQHVMRMPPIIVNVCPPVFIEGDVNQSLGGYPFCLWHCFAQIQITFHGVGTNHLTLHISASVWPQSVLFGLTRHGSKQCNPNKPTGSSKSLDSQSDSQPDSISGTRSLRD